MFKIFYDVMIYELKRIFCSFDIAEVIIFGLLIYFFFYPTPYLHEEVREVPIAVIDQNQSTMSRELLRMVNASDALSVTEHVDTLSEAKELLKQRKVFGILVIPYEFEQSVLQNRNDAVVFYGDASYVMIYSAASSGIISIVSSLNQQIMVNKQIQMGVDPSVAMGNSAPYKPVSVQLYNPEQGYATYVIPAVYPLILHQILWLGIMLACVIGRSSTFDIQLLQQDSQLSIQTLSLLMLLGKYCAYLFYGTFAFWAYMLFAPYWYELPRLGEIVDLAIMGFFFLSAIILMALFMASFFKRIDDVFLLILPSSMLLFFVSGMSWPQYQMPEVINWLVQLMPSTSGIEGLVRVNQMGATLNNVQPELLNLIVLTIGYGIAAYCVMTRYLSKLKKAQVS